jgi:hypothetical protein
MDATNQPGKQASADAPANEAAGSISLNAGRGDGRRMDGSRFRGRRGRRRRDVIMGTGWEQNGDRDGKCEEQKVFHE